MIPAESITRDCRKKKGPLAFKEMMELLPVLSIDLAPQGCFKNLDPRLSSMRSM